MSIKAIIVGASGRMGRELIKAVNESNMELAGAVDIVDQGVDSGELAGIGKNDIIIADKLEKVINECDVTMEFTSPDATIQHIKINQEFNKPAVIGTTALSEEQKEEIEKVGQSIPIVISPNMSVGVNVLFKLTELTASILKEGFDAEIIEAHHKLKKDAPSGTANKLLDILLQALKRDKEKDVVYGREGIIGERKDSEIGMSVIRAGDIVGEHTVLFAGTGERLELTHKASSRQTFARGAVTAAEWLVSQEPGLYSMFDVLGL